MADGTVADFQPSTQTGQTDQFVPSAAQTTIPSITQNDPESYAGLTVENARQFLQGRGYPVTWDDLKPIHEQALSQAQSFQADLAKTQAQKNLELQQRVLATQRGPQGQASLLETERAEEQGVALKKEQALEQWKQGGTASAEAAQLAQPGQPPPDIKELPADQRLRLEHLQTSYNALNDLQTLHTNMVNSAWGAGGNIRSTIGNLLQTDKTNKYARAYEALQDEQLTPLAIGVLGDKAAGATKANIQEQLAGTIPDRSDTLESAGNKIFMMKKNIMDQLTAMRTQNKGTYSTGEISDLYANLGANFNSPATQKYNLLSDQTPIVQVGNSPQGRQQVANAVLAGINQPNAGASPTPQPAGSPVPTPAPSNVSDYGAFLTD